MNTLPEPDNVLVSRDYKLTCRFCDKEDTWRFLVPPRLSIELAREKAVAQRDALLEALKEYGWHDEACPQYPTYAHPERWPACTCGFDAAIAAAEGEMK